MSVGRWVSTRVSAMREAAWRVAVSGVEWSGWYGKCGWIDGVRRRVGVWCCAGECLGGEVSVWESGRGRLRATPLRVCGAVRRAGLYRLPVLPAAEHTLVPQCADGATQWLRRVVHSAGCRVYLCAASHPLGSCAARSVALRRAAWSRVQPLGSVPLPASLAPPCAAAQLVKVKEKQNSLTVVAPECWSRRTDTRAALLQYALRLRDMPLRECSAVFHKVAAVKLNVTSRPGCRVASPVTAERRREQ